MKSIALVNVLFEYIIPNGKTIETNQQSLLRRERNSKNGIEVTDELWEEILEL